MNATIEPFVLDTYATLFRDEAAYQEFVKKVEIACQSGATPFFSNGKIIGVTVSRETGKRLLSERIITELMQDPAQLQRIVESMQEEPVPLE